MAKKALLVVITLAVLAVLFLIVRGLSPRLEPPGRMAATHPGPPATQEATAAADEVPPDFIEMRDETGRVVRRLEFADAVPHPDFIDITQLHFILYHDPDTAGRIAVTTLDAGQARLHRIGPPSPGPRKPMILDSKLEFGDAQLSRGVRVFHDGGTASDTHDDLHFRTDTLAYDHLRGRLETPDPVEGEGQGMWFRGTGLTGNIDPRTRQLITVRVHREVSMRLAGQTARRLFAAASASGPPPAAEGRQEPLSPVEITCSGDFSLLVMQRRATYYRDVRVKQDEAALVADDLVEIRFAEPPDPTPGAPRGVAEAPQRAFGPPQEVTARGRTVTLTDERPGNAFSAQGTELHFDVANKRGTLLGQPTATVRQGGEADAVLTARRFSFDRSENRPLTRAEGSPHLTVVQPAEAPGEKPRTVTVVCTGPIVLDNATSTATLTDQVKARVTQDGRTLSQIDADRMSVVFTAAGDQREARREIDRLTATGSVVAHEAQRRLRADELEVRFAVVDGRREATLMRTRGHVEMEELDTGRRATADEIVNDLARKRTTFTGTGVPATLWEPNRTVSAAALVVDQSHEPPGLSATGPGRLRLIATTDRDGRPLEKPETYLVDWREAMTFDSQAHRGTFKGAVDARLPDARLTCGNLDLFLTETKAEGQADGTIEVQRLEAATAVNFVSQDQSAVGDRLAWDVANEQAVVTGTAERPAEVRQGDNFVVAPRIELDRRTGALAARGPGRLRVSPSDTPPSAGTAGPPAAAARAGASFIRWTERMRFDSEAHTAEFRGGVEADFAGADLRTSGRRSAPGPRGVPGAPLGLNPGEIDSLTMTCAAMDVTFEDVQDTAPETTGRARQTVSHLVAREDVHVTAASQDVVRRFEGVRVTFTRALGMILIEGGPAGPAQFWSEEIAPSGAGFQDHVAAERIRFYPDAAEVRTEGTQVLSYTPRPRQGRSAPPPQEPEQP